MVETLDCELDCWFVTETVSVPLVLFAIVDVVRLHVYWSLLQAELHAAKTGLIENSIAASIAIAKIWIFILDYPTVNVYDVDADVNGDSGVMLICVV